MLYWLPDIKKTYQDKDFNNYKFLMTHKYGPKEEAIKFMGEEAYNKYVKVGIIYTPPECPPCFKNRHPDWKLFVREWELTYWWANFFKHSGIKRDYRCYFPFNIYYRIKYGIERRKRKN